MQSELRRAVGRAIQRWRRSRYMGRTGRVCVRIEASERYADQDDAVQGEYAYLTDRPARILWYDDEELVVDPLEPDLCVQHLVGWCCRANIRLLFASTQDPSTFGLTGEQPGMPFHTHRVSSAR